MAFFVCFVLKAFGLWFLIVGLVKVFKNPAGYAARAPRTSFACLIPARNEESVIGRSVGSLLAQSYPRELFEVFVLPNNCTDHTEEAALRAGAKTISVSGPVSCKGDVLRQAIRNEETRKYDAVCVFDADNMVTTDFLARMNDAFCAGARVAKGRLRALNTRESWVAGCYALYFGIFDWFFNRSRASLGMSAKLVGTGFAVSMSFLDETGGWDTDTIAEDAEFSAICAERGEKIWWVPEAVSYDEAPHSFMESLRQRRRWCSGIMDVSERKAGSLFSAAHRFLSRRTCGSAPVTPYFGSAPDSPYCGSAPVTPPEGNAGLSEGRLRAARAFDGAMFLCSPFVQAVSPILSIPAAAKTASLLTEWIGMHIDEAEALSLQAGRQASALMEGGAALIGTGAVLLMLTWLGLTAFGILIAALSGYRPSVIAKGVLMFPLFMISWLPLLMISLFFRTRNWKQIRHGCSMRQM